VVPNGKEFTTSLSAMDLTATIAAVAGAKPRADAAFDGNNILPAVSGTSKLDANRPLFFRRRQIRVRQNQNVIRQSAFRQGDWKYLRTYNIRDNDKFSAAL